MAFYNLQSGANFGTGTGIDESWYVQVSQEMSSSGQWWLPTREGVPFFYKPPLKFWLTSLSAKLFGDSIISYRMIDASEGAVIVLLTYITASLVFSSLTAGLFAVLSLLACWGFIFANGIRFATLDTQVMFFSVIVLLLLLKFTSAEAVMSKKQQIICGSITGLILGLAILTKSVLGYYTFGVYGVWLLLTGQILKKVTQLPWLLGSFFIVSIMIPSFWFLPHALFTEGAWARMFGDELINRFEKGFHNSNDPYLYWTAFKHQRYLPFYTTLIAIIVFAIRSIFLRDKKVAFFLVWAILPFAVFSALSSRLIWYVSPCYFPAAILCGGLISLLIDKIPSVLFSENKFTARASRSFVSLMALVLLAGILIETYEYAYANVRRVIVGTPRLAIDEAVEQLKSLKKPITLISYKAPVQATREKIFFQMLHAKDVSANNVSDLSSIIKETEVYAIFTDIAYAKEITNQLLLFGYYYLPPVAFPQGPNSFLRTSPALLLVGSKNPQLASTLSLLRPIKIVLKLAGDGHLCGTEKELAEKRTRPSFIPAKENPLSCHFNGGDLIESFPTRLSINIAHDYGKEDRLPVALEVYANYHRVGIINPLPHRQSKYNFSVPANTWLPGDNEIYLSLVNADHSRLEIDPKESGAILLNWLVVDLALANPVEKQPVGLINPSLKAHQ